MGSVAHPRAEFRGDAVLHGLPPDHKAFARGFTEGHDDARDDAVDSTNMLGRDWYERGYRAGVESVRAWG